MTVLSVSHITSYSYDRPVRFSEHSVLFRPRDSQHQRLLSSRLTITPKPADIHWIHDVFGNCVAIVGFRDHESADLRFETEITLDHTPESIPRFRTEPRARTWPLVYGDHVLPDLEPVMRRHYPDNGEVEAWARRFVPTDGSIAETPHVLMTMTTAIKESFRYNRRTDPGTQPPVETLATRSGTCRDYALLMIEAARSLGFAARFVTGYLYAPSRDTEEMRGGGATHAWVQVFLPGAGWVEFDPTNAIVGSRDLIRVGVARDPAQAKPLSGSFIGPRDAYRGMTVTVQVRTVKDGGTAAFSGASAGANQAISVAERVDQGGKAE